MKRHDVAGAPSCRKVRVLARELAVDFARTKEHDHLSVT